MANPGCYPTSVQLPLAPLLQRKLIEGVCHLEAAAAAVAGNLACPEPEISDSGAQSDKHTKSPMGSNWRHVLPQEDIIIDAKSGVSGAGRSVKQAFLYTEVAEGMNAYGVSRHRHMPEIEQVILTCQAA